MNLIIDTITAIKKNIVLNLLIFIIISLMVITANYIVTKKNNLRIDFTSDLRSYETLTDSAYDHSNVKFEQIIDIIISKIKNDLANLIEINKIRTFRIEPNNMRDISSNKKFSLMVEYKDKSDYEKLSSLISKNANKHSKEAIAIILEAKKINLESYLSYLNTDSSYIGVFENPKSIIEHVNVLIQFNNESDLFKVEKSDIKMRFFTKLFYILIFFSLIISSLITLIFIHLKKELNAN